MKIIRQYFLLYVICVMVACEKIIDPGSPATQISVKEIFSSDRNAVSYMSNLYSMVSTSISTYLARPMALYSDDLIYSATDPGMIEFDQGLISVNNTYNSQAWKECYSIIYYCNLWLEQVKNANKLSENVKNQITGEIFFFRAWSYFQLLQRYGKVPLVMNTEVKSSAIQGREELSVIKRQIEADINSSLQLLKGEYPSADRARVNRYTANALLARVSLYFGDWNMAFEQSALVLNSGVYHLEAMDKIFKVNSSETIFQLWNKGGYTQEGLGYIPGTGLPPGFKVREGLYNIFSQGDQRRTKWLGMVIDNGDTCYYPMKYKNRQETTGTNREYHVEFRLAEQLLIRAEASARKGDINGAIADLNKIRLRAETEFVEPPVNGDSVLSLIIVERRKELFTEAGLRFFDLQRTGAADQLLQPIKPSWKPTAILFPIPLYELQSNPKLTQNAGY